MEHKQHCLCCTVLDQWYMLARELVRAMAYMLSGKATDTHPWVVLPVFTRAVEGRCTHTKHVCIAHRGGSDLKQLHYMLLVIHRLSLC